MSASSFYRRSTFIVVLLCVSATLYAQKPTITSFAPTSGPVGTTVTIAGTNFSATPANNTVYFGATKAVVTNATATQLKVTVPVGATYQPITVLTNALVAYSNAPFDVTFTRDGSGFDSSTFGPSLDLQLPLGIVTVSTAIGDLDGDGKPDVVTANEVAGCSVFRNTTSGVISFAANVDFGAGTTPAQVIIADIDGDGKPDLVAPDYLNTTGVVVLRNTSSGPGSISFAPKLTFAVGTNPRSISVGDIDGDGKPDVAAGNTNSNSVSVLRNTSSVGAISFSAHVDFATLVERICMTDADGDAKPDLIVATGGGVSVFRNTSTSGSISYAPKIDLIIAARAVIGGDLDRDGKPDLATTDEFGGNVISVMRNISSGVGSINFAAKVDFATGVQPASMVIGDIDGDGKPDLAAVDSRSNAISLFWNTSAGPGSINFAPKVDFPSDAEPVSVSIGDLDGDNKAELVSVNIATSFISVFRNLIKIPPSITSISPLSGPVGTAVTITGTNFELTPSNNIVYFGAVRATVTAASLTSLTAIVPVGAAYDPVSVTANNLIAFSPKPFAATFYSGVTAFGATAFAAKASFTTGAAPVAETSADLDGDGKVDKVIVNRASNSISILRNTSTGSGSVSFAPKISVPTGIDPFSVALGDLDGDGKLDIAVGNYTSQTVSVFRNSSTGPGAISLDPKIDIAAPGQPKGASIRDLNKDGRADLVLANYSSGDVSVFKNIGTSIGSISLAPAIAFAVGGFPSAVAIGDLDNDGLPDIATSTAGGNTVALLKNTSSGGTISFGVHVDFAAAFTESICIADVDLDGNPDIVAGNLNFGLGNTLSIFRNTGTTGAITSSSFAARVDFTTGQGPTLISVADHNGDAKPDLATSNLNGNSVSVFINQSSPGTISTASFAPKVDFPAGQCVSGSIVDLDGDGKLDISFTEQSQNIISVLRRQIVPVAPTALPATLIGQTVFTSNWSASTGATTGYYLDVSTSNGFGTFVTGYSNLFVGNVLSFKVDTNITPNTTYYYRVRGADGLLKSSNSNISSVGTLSNPVATAATQIGPDKFIANWNAVAGATGYFLDVATDNGFLNLVASNVNVGNILTYALASLDPNTNYYFRVRANNASGSSPNSNIISVTTLSALPTLQSSSIIFSNVTSTSLSLSFTPGNGTSHLVVVNANAPLSTVPSNAVTYVPNSNYGQGSQIGSGFVVGNGSGTIAVTGLSPATPYYFQVYDFNGSGGTQNYLTTTSATNPLSQNTLATAPASQATNLSFSNPTSSSVTVSFNAAAGSPAGYLVIRSAGSASSAQPVNTVSYSTGAHLGTTTVASVGSSLSFLDSGLPTDTKYFYSVFAFNGSGTSLNYQTINPLQGSITLDTSAPLIIAPPSPNPTSITAGNTPTFSAIITDNVRVDTAKIFYRAVSDAKFKSAVLNPSGVTGVFSIQVQATWYDAFGLEYYFWAVDENGNKTAKPSSTNFVQLINSSLGIPGLPAGSDQNSYRIVSFPYLLATDNKVTTVFPGVPWNDNTKAALWWWDPTLKGSFTGGYIQYGANADFQIIEPGKGYWMLVSTPASPQLSNVLAPKYNRSNLFSMTLKPKWNEVGNPYPVPISWDDVIAFNQANNPGALFSQLISRS
jgi:hypothetical protein